MCFVILLGEENDDILYGYKFLDDHMHLGDTVLANDAFETQRLDYDCETPQLDFDCDTQLLDFDCETLGLDFDGREALPLDRVEGTQVVDFGEETRVVNVGEETQVMDVEEGDCCDIVETQLLPEPNEEETVVATDEEDTVGTEVLTDAEVSADIDSLKRSIDKSVGSEGMQPTSSRGQAEAKSKSAGSFLSPDAACSSG